MQLALCRLEIILRVIVILFMYSKTSLFTSTGHYHIGKTLIEDIRASFRYILKAK